MIKRFAPGCCFHLGYLIILLVITATLCAETTTKYSAGSDFCNEYCNKLGLYEPSFWCLGTAEEPNYCCGTPDDKYCCDDEGERLDQGNDKAPSRYCDTQWVFWQRMIIGVLTTLILMLILAACCYYCYSGEGYRAARRRRRQRQAQAEMANASSSNGREPGYLNFNPNSPHAFEPPDYDSLPKDPPNYLEIFGSQPVDVTATHTTWQSTDIDQPTTETHGQVEPGTEHHSEQQINLQGLPPFEMTSGQSATTTAPSPAYEVEQPVVLLPARPEPIPEQSEVNHDPSPIAHPPAQPPMYSLSNPELHTTHNEGQSNTAYVSDETETPSILTACSSVAEPPVYVTTTLPTGGSEDVEVENVEKFVSRITIREEEYTTKTVTTLQV